MNVIIMKNGKEMVRNFTFHTSNLQAVVTLGSRKRGSMIKYLWTTKDAANYSTFARCSNQSCFPRCLTLQSQIKLTLITRQINNQAKLMLIFFPFRHWAYYNSYLVFQHKIILTRRNPRTLGLFHHLLPWTGKSSKNL